MSKLEYLIISVVCALICFAGVFFYWNKISSYPKFSTPPEYIVVPKERVTEEKKEENKEIFASSSTKSVSLLAVGDIMLDRSVMLKTQAAGDYNYPFLFIDPLFQKYDLHLANLEGPITTNKSVANGTGGARFTFTFSPKFVEPLKKRFEFLSLANNHEYNFGQNGLDQTRKFLDDAGVKYFGDPNNIQKFISVTSSYNGITFGFVGYHQLIEKGFENVLSEIKILDSQVDVLIAMPHWGAEYATSTMSFLQKKEGHEMIDAGVDIIFGAHPHVVEPIEIYKEKPIFYSLGNFIFDQYFSEDTMTGLAVAVQFEKESDNSDLHMRYTLLPLDISRGSQVSLATASKTEKVLRHLSVFSKVDESLKEKIKNAEFEL